MKSVLERINKEYAGLLITEALLKDSVFKLRFENGNKLSFCDEGQDCCEKRYFSCDDNLSELIGSKFIEISVSKSSSYTDKDSDYDTHEIMFLNILSSSGNYQIASHNVHNGFYGGFDLKVIEKVSVLNGI